jgi:tetratricopeptide (TPR) repeat protein
MIRSMSPRKVVLASVSSAFLAACVAVSGPAAAATQNSNTLLAAAAYKSLANGDPATAVESYSTAIESRELEAEVLANALLNRALAYQHLNRHELAVDDYSAAMRIDAMTGKLRAMALYNRGLSFQKLHKPALAMEDFTSALFLDSGFAHAYYSRANLLRQSGQYLFALSDFEKALQFKHPEPARVYYGEALTYDALRRPRNAGDALAKALAANPQFQPAKTRLAGGSAPPKTVPVADHITTASIGGIAGGGVVARKKALPQAAAPAAELLGSDGVVLLASTAPRKKSITDRVPMEQAAAATVAEETAAPAEKIIAVEPVPDAPAAETAPPSLAGWSVQVASATSEDAAWSTWKKMKARHRLLSGKTPVVVKADLGTKGTYYRVRLTGYDNQGDAKSACSKLKSKGVTCFISKASS